MIPDQLVLIVDLRLLSSEAESTCLSPCQSSNTTSSETFADASSDYEEPPSKSTTASNNLSSNDDAFEIETSEIVQKKKYNRTLNYESNKI